MSGEKLLSLADFEWASAARYLVYISSVANLKEINSNHVISFPLGRLGPDKLLKQKERVLFLLEGNKSAIESFVGEHRNELVPNELVALRSLYVQYKGSIETVKSHIKIIKDCAVEIEFSFLRSGEADKDDALF